MNSRATKVVKEVEAGVVDLAPTVSLPVLLDKGDEPDRTFRQLLYDISIVGSHLESARQYLAGRLGVTSPQYNIVMVVARSAAPNGISVSDVAARLNVTGAFVTTEVNKLVKARLLTKKANPDDGRGVLIGLSTHGHERVHALGPDLLMVNDQLFRTLSREDFHHLARTVGSLIGVFSQTVAVLKAMSTTSAATGPLVLPSPPDQPRKRSRKS